LYRYTGGVEAGAEAPARFGDGYHQLLSPRESQRNKKSGSGFFGWVFGVFGGGGGEATNGVGDGEYGYLTPRGGRNGNAVVPINDTGPLSPGYSPGGGTPGGGGCTPGTKKMIRMKRKEKLEMAQVGGMMHRHRSGNYKYRPLFADTPAGKRSRTAVRLIVYFLIIACIVGAYMLCAWLLGQYESSRTFDSTATMVVEVNSCDVVIRSGAEAKVTVEGILTAISSVEWYLPTSQQVTVTGADDCTGEMMMRCYELCRVFVDCPAGTAHIRVQQSGDDVALAPLVTVQGDVDVGIVEVRGAVSWATAGPTLGVEFQPGAKVAEAIAYTSAGHIVADGVNFGGAFFWSISGSVSVTSAALESDDATLKFRQPEGKTCVAVAGSASITAGLPWAEGNPVDDSYSAARVMATFDADNNLQVDTTEFIDGIASLNKCCGGSCPSYTFCNPLRFEAFDQVTSVDDQETVSLLGEVAFLQRLVDLNYTWAVPRQDGVATVAFSSAAAATSRTFTLRSEAGEVRFTAAQGTTTEASASIAAGNLSDTAFARTYVPGGRQSGVRLNKKWADKLRDDLYTAFVESSTDVLAIIQVEGSPGVPASRWGCTS
jgi:hypothetical protein